MLFKKKKITNTLTPALNRRKLRVAVVKNYTCPHCGLGNETDLKFMSTVESLGGQEEEIWTFFPHNRPGLIVPNGLYIKIME